MPKIIPESLNWHDSTSWAPGNPPQPSGGTQHASCVCDDGNLWHKFWDGHAWSAWENLGHP